MNPFAPQQAEHAKSISNFLYESGTTKNITAAKNTNTTPAKAGYVNNSINL